MLLLEQFENLTLHPKNAARLKELVLQLAVQGKLTKNWRRQNPDVEPAAELLDRIEAEKAQLVKENKIKDYALSPVAADEVSCHLPDTWSWVKIGEVLDLINGKAFKPTEWAESGLPIIRIQNLNNLNADFNYCDKEVDEKYYVNNGDLLIGWSGTPGTSFGAFIWTRGEAVLNQHIFNAKQYVHTFNTDYLKISINSILDEMISKAHGGAGLKHITKGKFQNIALAIPPLAEQEAIVERVEDLMQKIEELEKQTVDRIQLKQHLGAAALQQLTAAAGEELEQNWLFLKQHFQTMFDEAVNVKKLRETILQLAVQGKLTATWRTQNPTTEPASELLKRIQAEKAQLVKEKKIKKEKPLDPISEDEVPYTLPEGWTWSRFSDLLLDIEAGKSPSCDPQEASLDEWGVIKISAVSWGEFLERENKKLPPSVLPFEDKEIMPGDFIMSRANTADLIARSVVVGDSVRSKLLLNDKTLRVRFQSDTVKAYCNLFNNCSVARAYYKEVASGTSDSMKNIGREQIKDLLIPLPPEVEQQAIYSKVDQLMQLCDKLEKQIQQSKKEAEALMQAVVQEALQVNEEVLN